ncbi:MAG: hypothetical protein AAF587_19015 [Bacteroidota bacterium]
MKIRLDYWGSLLLMVVLLSPAMGQEASEITFPPGREGVEQMILYLLDANSKERKEYTKRLLPTLEDCEAIFDGKMGKKVYRYQKRLKRRANIVIRPLLKDQTEYLLFQASSEDLSDYDKDEARNFPGGYHELAEYFRPGIMFYRFKFVQPNRKLGSAYDVLVHVNGNWRLIHRPWVVLINGGS